MPSTQQGEVDSLKAGTGVCSSGPSGQSSTQPGEGGMIRDVSLAPGIQTSLLREETTFPSTVSSTLMRTLPPPPPREAVERRNKLFRVGDPCCSPSQGTQDFGKLRENWTTSLRMATGQSFESGQEVWCGIIHHRGGWWQQQLCPQ